MRAMAPPPGQQDAPKAWQIATTVAEDYLRDRTTGTAGKPGKPDRVKPPNVIEGDLIAPSRPEDGGESTATIRHLRAQQRRVCHLWFLVQGIPRPSGIRAGHPGSYTEPFEWTEEARLVWEKLQAEGQVNLGPASDRGHAILGYLDHAQAHVAQNGPQHQVEDLQGD